jgi:hypothetical protein
VAAVLLVLFISAGNQQVILTAVLEVTGSVLLVEGRLQGVEGVEQMLEKGAPAVLPV